MTVQVSGTGEGIDLRNQQQRAAFTDLPEPALNFLLGVRIERRGGLVQHDDLGVFQNRPCDSHALAFSSAQSKSTVADFGVVPVREGHDPIVNARGPTSLVNFLVGGCRVGVFQVVHQCLVEQGRVLGHNSDEPPHRVDCQVLDVLVIDLDTSPGAIIIAEHEPEDGRLAPTRFADERRCGTWGTLKIDVLQSRSTIAVVEGNVVPSDAAVALLQRLGARSIQYGGLNFEQFQQPLARDHGLLNVAVKSAEEVQRALQLVEIGNQRNEVTNSALLARHLVRPEDQDDSGARHKDKGLDDVHLVNAPCNLGFCGLEDANGVTVSFELPGFSVEIFDRLIASDRVVLHSLFLSVGIGHGSTLVGSGPRHPDGEVEIPEGDTANDHGVGGIEDSVKEDDCQPQVQEHWPDLESDLLEELIDGRALVKCRQDLACSLSEVKV